MKVRLKIDAELEFERCDACGVIGERWPTATMELDGRYIGSTILASAIGDYVDGLEHRGGARLCKRCSKAMVDMAVDRFFVGQDRDVALGMIKLKAIANGG